MIFTKRDQVDYKKAKKCWICQEPFPEEDGRTQGKIKVRGHCHWTGKFRGAAHSSCNLRLTEQKFIPVIFHNLKGYDSHIFINAFNNLEEEPSCIPKIQKNSLVFP